MCACHVKQEYSSLIYIRAVIRRRCFLAEPCFSCLVRFPGDVRNDSKAERFNQGRIHVGPERFLGKYSEAFRQNRRDSNETRELFSVSWICQRVGEAVEMSQFLTPTETCKTEKDKDANHISAHVGF